MGKGISDILEIASKQEEGDFIKKNYFKLSSSGDSAVVRFLEQGDDVTWCYVHPISFPGKQYPIRIPCRNQSDNDPDSCPACAQDIQRGFRGYINLIWRDAGEDGEDTIALWEQGIGVFSELGSKDQTYEGLSSRDFRITRKGTGKKSTRYFIEPAEVDSGPKSLSKNDKELLKIKYDLNQVIQPPTYERYEEMLGQSSESADIEEEETKINPFMK